MNLFLIRHGQSIVNVNREFMTQNPNMLGELTELGRQQAALTGEYLAQELKNSFIDKSKIVVWNSPYLRTTQTADIIKEKLDAKGIKYKSKESIYLAERQFGLLDNHAEIEATHKPEIDHYKMHVQQGEDFWVRPPLGESPFDMCLRIDSFIQTHLGSRHDENTSNQTHIFVAHGAWLRGFMMMYQELTYKEYLAMPNPGNAALFEVSTTHANKLFVPPQRERNTDNSGE